MASKSSHPVLHLKQEPIASNVSTGGKSGDQIIIDRLEKQRLILSGQLSEIYKTRENYPIFNQKSVIYVEMFDDSLAKSYCPNDLFSTEYGCRFIAHLNTGYLIEIESQNLKKLAHLVQQAERITIKVDISRVASVVFFSEQHVLRKYSEYVNLWNSAKKIDSGRLFTIWLMPFYDKSAGTELIRSFNHLINEDILSYSWLLNDSNKTKSSKFTTSHKSKIATQIAKESSHNNFLSTYNKTRHARTTVVVPNQSALKMVVTSGTIFRIDPVPSIITTVSGDGPEPTSMSQDDLENQPIVGVIDGGLNSKTYLAAVAWRARSFIKDYEADTKHGNKIASLIVNGHAWNNNLSLPKLNCKLGIVQAIPKRGSMVLSTSDSLINYIDKIIADHPDTKVWNLSFNFNDEDDWYFNDEDEWYDVSAEGHKLTEIARERNVLLVIAGGNKPGSHIKPPADCEAAISVGGCLHNDEGKPGGHNQICLGGPGPANMLKPEISHFSEVRTLGGQIETGSSYSTALTSVLAAHTMSNLLNPSPDLVKALIIHNTGGNGFDSDIGFGAPTECLPWLCRPGFVTLQWTAELRPGAAFYWKFPIPPCLIKTGRLKGEGKLTTILNPYPYVSEFAETNYFSVRLEAALQCVTAKGTKNLIGKSKTNKMTEQQLRKLEQKWSPVKHNKNSFNIHSYGEFLQVYSRVYMRDEFLYNYINSKEIEPLKATFVLSLSSGDITDDIYNEFRSQLGNFVENSTIDNYIEVDENL